MSLDPMALFRSMPGAFAQGLVWGLMALGVYITYRLLDFADLTVDGSLATGGAVAVILIRSGMHPWAALIFAFLAGMAAGFITGILHTALGIPGILASILTQISLYSINLNIMGSSNQAVSVDKYPLVVSLRYISDSSATKVRLFVTCVLFCVAVVALLYWYFGTEQGHAIRATGCNRQMARAQGINTGSFRGKTRTSSRSFRACEGPANQSYSKSTVATCAIMESQATRLYPSTLKTWSSSRLRRIEHSTTTFPPDSSPIR